MIHSDKLELFSVDKTTVIAREEGLDKFYTTPFIVDKCIFVLQSNYDWNSWDLILEPSAGNGSFLTKIPSPNKIGIDISPEHHDIILNTTSLIITPIMIKKLILLIGNPPFSLALKFFSHASKWTNVIAFILPKTSRRISVQNKLNSKFHLIDDIEIPNKLCSFYPPIMVKCCFQIWEKKQLKGKLLNYKPNTNIGISYHSDLLTIKVNGHHPIMRILLLEHMGGNAEK